MPTYVYKFTDTGETIEVFQAFTDDALTEAMHPTTGATMQVKKVFLPVGVTFKGGGFYKTDSRGGSSSSSSNGSGSNGSGSNGSGSNGSDSKPSTTSTPSSDSSGSSSSEKSSSSAPSSGSKTPAPSKASSSD